LGKAAKMSRYVLFMVNIRGEPAEPKKAPRLEVLSFFFELTNNRRSKPAVLSG